MKVLVTGSRDWTDYITIREALRHFGATVVIHGAARGADTLAKTAARELRIPERGYPANWAAHRRSAGPRRNAHMLKVEHRPDEPIDMVLAFPLDGSKGTWDMVEQADREGIPFTVILDRRAFQPYQ